MEAHLNGFTIVEGPIRHHDPHNYRTQGATELHPAHNPGRETAANKMTTKERLQKHVEYEKKRKKN